MLISDVDLEFAVYAIGAIYLISTHIAVRGRAAFHVHATLTWYYSKIHFVYGEHAGIKIAS